MLSTKTAFQFATGVLGLLAVSAASAQSGGTTYECTTVAIDSNAAGRHLTRAERIARLEGAFYDSVDRYDGCQAELMKSGNSATSGSQGGGAFGSADANGNGAGQGETAGDGRAGQQSAQQSGQGQNAGFSGASFATTSISGTEARELPQRSSKASGRRSEDSWKQEEVKAEAPEDDEEMKGSGRVPADIPPADNDSVLETQIREAAMREEDPEKREKLWDTYRRYKGIEKESEE